MHDSKICILAPCYNEGQVILSFLDELNSVLSDVKNIIQIVIVDDGSNDDTRNLLNEYTWDSDKKLDILLLNSNIGHQGAISQGLQYCCSLEIDDLIVMDSDGEDDPKAILDLVELSDHPIVFVARKKRKESTKFKIFYSFYKLLFLIITGKRINFGNYSMISKEVLSNVKNHQFVHYSAFLSKLKNPKKVIFFDRRSRFDGSSKMNLDSLILHGFKSFVEYAEDLFFIFLKLFVVIFLFIIGAAGVLLYKKFILKSAVLGWTSSLMVSLIIMAILCLGFFVLGTMQLYSFRKLEGQLNHRIVDTYKVINK